MALPWQWYGCDRQSEISCIAQRWLYSFKPVCGFIRIFAGADRRYGISACCRVRCFYRAGSLVFGGGHVVLPLLQAEVVTPQWVSKEAFLAGYGLAQAVPGPLFTFAAYLGAVMQPEPKRHCRCFYCSDRDILAGLAACLWHASVLGQAAFAPDSTGGNAWCQCSGCRHTRCGTV